MLDCCSNEGVFSSSDSYKTLFEPHFNVCNIKQRLSSPTRLLTWRERSSSPPWVWCLSWRLHVAPGCSQVRWQNVWPVIPSTPVFLFYVALGIFVFEFLSVICLLCVLLFWCLFHCLVTCFRACLSSSEGPVSRLLHLKLQTFSSMWRVNKLHRKLQLQHFKRQQILKKSCMFYRLLMGKLVRDCPAHRKWCHYSSCCSSSKWETHRQKNSRTECFHPTNLKDTEQTCPIRLVDRLID